MELLFGSVSVHLGAQSGKYPDGNQVLVRGGELTVAFDTPVASRLRGDLLKNVDLVILGHVHEDHMAALDLLGHAALQVHRLDLEAARSWDGLKRHYGYAETTLSSVRQMIERDFHYAPRPDALPYDDGQTWQLGAGVRISAQHLPGHTAGHCALVVENEGVAFIGDIDLSGFGPYYGDATSNLADFRHTLKRVAELDARVWVTSHHKAVITDRTQFLADLGRFAARIDQRTESLLQRLQQRPQTLDELADAGFLYPPGHGAPWTASAERRTLQQHLDELLADATVRLDHGIYALA
ncbi:MAG: MBL fold metallo-hydrolase [Alphaproteobacteria bacterium]|nr:MBL fold metallo-hydrolase [Alphaproteobacteria bacterium]